MLVLLVFLLRGFGFICEIAFVLIAVTDMVCDCCGLFCDCLLRVVVMFWLFVLFGLVSLLAGFGFELLSALGFS